MKIRVYKSQETMAEYLVDAENADAAKKYVDSSPDLDPVKKWVVRTHYTTDHDRMFHLGQLICTAGVNELRQENPEFDTWIKECLKRHASGDWGEVDAEDKATNDAAVTEHLRILSAYTDDRFPQHGISTIWIITERDRSRTTILFPDEY